MAVHQKVVTDESGILIVAGLGRVTRQHGMGLEVTFDHPYHYRLALAIHNLDWPDGNPFDPEAA